MKANLLHILRSLHNDETGQDLIEYALIAALIATAAVATMTTLGGKIASVFTNIAGSL